MNDDDLLKGYRVRKQKLRESLEEQAVWNEEIERDFKVSDLTKDYISLGELTEKPLYDLVENNISSLMNHNHVPFNYREGIEAHNKTIKEKEAEELRRHNEQVELLKKQIQILSSLLRNSQNSNEQRDAIIHFMVRMMIQMEASQKEKKKTLSGILMQISSFTAFGADVSSIYEFIENELKKLSKED
ncbi:hypothetical protein [Exiguobacterium sp. UBA5002]|uniref:hypothetical protein n=1 Tax=Exiguobacterium sp. UBA5002 TaxID=1946497 RepID=UPI0025BDDE98|nr:hypothetical protein [Exiguobacterium sp. UBA5002]